MSFPNIDWKTFGVICRVALLYNWLFFFFSVLILFSRFVFTVPSTTALALAFLILHTTGWNVHNTLGFYWQFGYDLTWLISSYLARDHRWNNAGKYCHITLFKLHWLPIRECILFKILLITYKAVHGHAPNYIKELIKFKKPEKYNLRSNSDNLLLEIEKMKTYTTLGDRAFQVAAPKLWNNLPFNIRSSLLLPSFKKALKTYLFREAFP